MAVRRSVFFSVFALIPIIVLMVGCAGLEYAPKRNLAYYHKELPAAERAVEAARAAGKDKECPAEFMAVEKLKNSAYDSYLACRTTEAISKANEATTRANALCPKKVEAPKPAPVAAPPPPPPPAPTVSLMADPASVEKGKCANLTWSSANASTASIDQAIGKVDPSGSRQVCPDATTQYTVTVTGEGGTRTASTTVQVTPPPPPPAPKPIARLAVHVNFDTDKAQIRKDNIDELQKAIEFVKKYPGHQISVEGHADNRGSTKYNQALSEKRAAAVKKYMIDNGVADADKIVTKGLGETMPVADNATEKGRFENRRVEILIFPK